MKKILIIALSLGLLSFNASAQTKTKVKAKAKSTSVAAPSVVSSSFDTAYSGIETKKWSKNLNGNYIATFKNSSDQSETAEFNKDGELQRSKITWDVENLPEAIKLSLDSTYSGAKIVSAERIKIKDINPFFNIKITTTENLSKMLLVSEEGTITE